MKCQNCGSELNLEPVADPQIDWIDIVCSDCGESTQVSLARELEREEQQEVESGR